MTQHTLCFPKLVTVMFPHINASQPLMLTFPASIVQKQVPACTH